MEQKFNNEVIGISAEIAVADTFKVSINENYRKRGENDIVNVLENLLKENITEIFPKGVIPIEHVAEGGNPIDFKLNNGKTLSVKTNKRQLGKVAPQIIGQPTAETYFSHMKNELLDDIPEFDDIENKLKERKLEDNYENRSKIFKEISVKYIDIIINEYWKNLVECDYLLFFYNIIGKDKKISKNPEYIIVTKELELPNFEKENFSFTKTLTNWNESNTVKYNYNGTQISIGEFQVHRNRNCFKFRFNIKNILKIINS
ncbi:hypothetical protein LDK17_00795 [Fusobacterium polymorphum]|uniref:hypothetical protein n=1 Tax=Fusobacterium nucleatum subsp. polymorphum TaxID=76857 RepID=UPI0030D5872D